MEIAFAYLRYIKKIRLYSVSFFISEFRLILYVSISKYQHISGCQSNAFFVQ